MISEQLYGVMSGKSTTNDMSAFRVLMEKYKEDRMNLIVSLWIVVSYKEICKRGAGYV